MRVHYAYYDDPWMIERSRSMNAEMDASPQQDDATINSILERHILAAKKDRPDVAANVMVSIEDGLMRAALVDHPTSGRWGVLEADEEDEGLEALLDPIRERQRAESANVYDNPDRREAFAAGTALLAKHVEERRRIIQQWYAEKHARAKDA